MKVLGFIFVILGYIIAVTADGRFALLFVGGISLLFGTILFLIGTFGHVSDKPLSTNSKKNQLIEVHLKTKKDKFFKT